MEMWTSRLISHLEMKSFWNRLLGLAFVSGRINVFNIKAKKRFLCWMNERTNDETLFADDVYCMQQHVEIKRVSVCYFDGGFFLGGGGWALIHCLNWTWKIARGSTWSKIIHFPDWKRTFGRSSVGSRGSVLVSRWRKDPSVDARITRRMKSNSTPHREDCKEASSHSVWSIKGKTIHRALERPRTMAHQCVVVVFSPTLFDICLFIQLWPAQGFFLGRLFQIFNLGT